jgi:hypothetical protein
MPLLLLIALLAPTPVATADYPWMEDVSGTPPMVRLSDRFPPPEGFTRPPAEAGSYAHWLRGLPLRTDRTNVLAYDGRRLIRPSAAVAVLDVGTRDLQQCADTALRLHAEYLWHAGRAHRAAYHFTSGDRSSWRDWRRGERFVVKGAQVKRVAGKARGGSHRSYRRWLTHLFRYAGTRSLKFDSEPVGERPVAPGDFYVQPGGPGHAVIIMDVATHADGRRAALVGQSFMPAEELHILASGGARVLDGAWFLLPGPGQRLDTPSWAPFAREDARRFRD